MNRKLRQTIFTHIGLILVAFILMAPVLFAFSKSTQTTAQIYHYPPTIGFGTSIVKNYATAWNEFKLGLYMKNSFIIAIIVTVAKTILSLLTGLALVYFDFPLKAWVFYFILFTLMMPTQILIVALFDLVSKMGMGNSYAALTMPFLASATGVFLFRQHFSSIPGSLADAARVDGAGPIRFLWSVLIPMSWNTIGALALIQFIYMWNQYLWPLVIIREGARQVIQVGLRSMTAQQDVTNWGVVMAGAILAMLPPLIVFLLLHEQFTKGFALGREK
ncbi:MAG TPA: carbohydrate ABC transporter permease [Candidatus Acetothermia bacterium]|nr:carbohydrate ABC transporter permease [Candidatus Acetothermia bacterium]